MASGDLAMSENDDCSFEARMKRLEEIVKALESPDLPLESGLELYKEGVQCARFCKEKLENARHEIEIWSEEGKMPSESSLDSIPPNKL